MLVYQNNLLREICSILWVDRNEEHLAVEHYRRLSYYELPNIGRIKLFASRKKKGRVVTRSCF